MYKKILLNIYNKNIRKEIYLHEEVYNDKKEDIFKKIEDTRKYIEKIHPTKLVNSEISLICYPDEENKQPFILKSDIFDQSTTKHLINSL